MSLIGQYAIIFLKFNEPVIHYVPKQLIMSDTHFIFLTASDKGSSRGAGRISAVPRNTCQHMSQDRLHIHAPGSQELHGGR